METRSKSKKNERQAQVLKLAKNCIEYMKKKSLYLAKEGRSAPSFGISELMNSSLVPEDFELRWDVARGVVDAMKESIAVGLVEKTYGRSSSGAFYRYKGPDLVRILDQARKADEDRKSMINATARKYGVKIDLNWFRDDHRVTMSAEDFLKLVKKKSR